ncbi:MAG TPA: CFI-box-CTERM domain-containing protein [Brevundimonas sp.]|nr:CFI-box-CTERM domain-containing protein [Brevundimonas sp.]
MSSDQNIANLLGMARTAQLGGNHEEALGYFNRVLEIDPKISEAWVGKGKAAGWQSTLANLRLGEAIIAFGHAIATAEDPSKTATTTEVVDQMNRIVTALYSLARDQLVTYAALDNTWPSYLGQVGQMIDALDEVRKWEPQNRTTLENVVHLCKDNIEGYSFRDQYNNNMPAAHGITESYERMLRDRLNQAVSALQTIDSSYNAPSIEKKKADACFVVTATMGDFNHPHVTTLREFRDRWLLQQSWGQAFVDAYYRHGPGMAALIEKRPLLRALSLRLLVQPAALIARKRLS